MTVDQLIKDVIEIEGGFSNHPKDRAGPTKYGITRFSYANYFKINAADVSAETIRIMRPNVAARIYRKIYITDPGINHLPEQIQPIVFDMAVNHGPNRAIKILQQTLWDAGYNAGSVDGIIGQRTIKAAVNAITDLGGDFINSIVSARVDFYEKIIENDPSQAVFKKGWLTRAESFRQVIA